MGKLKDECEGKEVIEFGELRSKIYNYKVGDEKENRAKSVRVCHQETAQ